MAVEKITQPITQVGLINKVNELIDQSITVDSTISSTSENPVQNKVIYQALTSKADATAIPTKTSDLTNDSNFLQTITVNGTAQAATGTTVDISIPAAQTIGDAYLTVKRNGTTVGSFSANSTVPVNIDITVPTQASDIGALPDSTVIGAGDVTIKRNGTAIGTINANQTVSAAIDITVPAIPTVVSAFTNDAGYLSSISSGDVTTALGYTPYNSSNPSGYQANTLETVKVNGTALTPSSKTVDITIPDAPTVGSANLTIQKNGSGVATFSANSTVAVTANITVPTTITELASTTQMAAINSGVTSTVVTQVGTNTSGIAAINSLIPSEATSSNQLADKSFVNSSISTNTANFIGTFNSVAELEAYSGTLTNNDYAFVVSTDTAGNTVYNRYKYNASEQEWLFEYALNNSSFTAAQWGAINSNITSTLTAQITTNKNEITTIKNTLSGYGDIVTHSASEFATAAQGSLASSALQPGASNTLLTNDAGYITGITSTMVTSALGYTPYSNANPGGYQANVLETIKVNGTALTPSSKTVDITVPTSMTIDTVISSTSTNPVQNKVIYGALTAKADKTEIPTVGEANLVVKQNGTAVGTFGANATSPVTINVTNTTYSAGSGLSLSGTTINHSNSVTAGTIGSTATTTGSSIAIPYATFDAQGHVTGKGTHTHTLSIVATYTSATETLTLALG